MRWLRSVRLRLFLAVFAASSLLFATNLAREHYPAFALAQHGTLQCDEWAGLHPDLFLHTDGHWYANNQVGASLVAAPLLALCEPLLAKLEEIGKRDAAARAAAGAEPPAFDSAYPRRAAFMAEVRKRGLHLRFGAAAAITAVGVMAPAAALLALLFHGELLRRGVAAKRAAGLALLFPLATPLLFRSAFLNHNQLEALLAFGAFTLLRPGEREPVAARRLFAGGLCAAGTLLFDYSGAVIAAWFGGALLLDRWRGRSASPFPFALGAALPLGLLFFTQWWQFGDPFRPAQHWMPDAHWSVAGYRGFDWPSAELLWRNLLDPSYGHFAFAPLLLLAFKPAPADAPPAVAPAQQRFTWSLAAAFVLFSAANQFTRLQWNSGFRGLAPLAPFLALLAARPLAEWPARRVALVAAPCVLHSLVLAMARATPPLAPASFSESTVARSWQAFFADGFQLPWHTVLRQSIGGGSPWVAGAFMLGLAMILYGMWGMGEKAAAAAERAR